MKKTIILMLLSLSAHLYAEEPQQAQLNETLPPVELEMEFFYDCTLADNGLTCDIPEETEVSPALKALDQFQKPVQVGWIPALGVFIVVDQDAIVPAPIEESAGSASKAVNTTTATSPAPQSVAFMKLDKNKTTLIPADIKIELNTVQKQIATDLKNSNTTTTPGQVTFQVQYQLAQNADQNKNNADYSAIIAQQRSNTYSQANASYQQ
ncbi:MAG: hypothetical protein Q7T03_00400 [Deltaproteobacteria bacterium]|nr:hypothetical protein [Deltaproteobacteria bacterium]